MSLSMVVNWAQRRLVSMKAPVYFFLAKVGEKQLSGEGGSLSRGKRSRTPAVFISCHWSAIQLPCNSYTYCHFHVLKINTNARNWSQRSTFLVKMYFHHAILMRMDVCQDFGSVWGRLCGTFVHSGLPISIPAAIFCYWLPSEAIIAAAHSITGDVLENEAARYKTADKLPRQKHK